MKPLAQHNAEMAAHMEQWFPADPGKTPRLFTWSQPSNAWLTGREAVEARAGFLNYDDKIEVVRQADGTTLVLKRRDMTEAEFRALPVAEDASEQKGAANTKAT